MTTVRTPTNRWPTAMPRHRNEHCRGVLVDIRSGIEPGVQFGLGHFRWPGHPEGVGSTDLFRWYSAASQRPRGFGQLFLHVSTEDLPPRASRPLPLRPRLNKGSGCCRRRSLRIRRAGRRYPERHGERHAAARIGLQRFHACPARRVRASRRGFAHSLAAGFMDSTRPAAYPAAAGLPTWAQHSARSTSAYGRHR